MKPAYFDEAGEQAQTLGLESGIDLDDDGHDHGHDHDGHDHDHAGHDHH